MNDPRRTGSYEPRTAVAQLIFGVIYAMITLIGIMLAYYVYTDTGSQPLMQYFFTVLFGIMTLKSFAIWARGRNLMKLGRETDATVENVIYDHGITKVLGHVTLTDGSKLSFESRYAGEALAHELNRYLKDSGKSELPALVVGESGSRPRAMFKIPTLHGHLSPAFALKDVTVPEDASDLSLTATEEAQDQDPAAHPEQK